MKTAFATVAHRAFGLAVARVGLAAGIVHFYISSYDDRLFLWGSDSVVAHAAWIRHGNLLEAVSPYRLWSSSTAFEVLFHTGILLAVAFGVFGGRLLAAANWIMLQSLHGQNPLLLDGGDNLLRIVLLLIILTDNNLYLSIGAGRRRERLGRSLQPGTVRTRFFVHNCGVFLLVFQVLALYAAAVLWKLSGEPWRDGTALYYVSRATEFSYRPLPPVVADNPIVVTLLTYGVILAQIAIVWSTVKRKRPYAVMATALVLHGGIALSMGLITFSVVILSADAVLVGDAAWARLASLLTRAVAGGERTSSAGRTTGWRPLPSMAPAPVGRLRSEPGTAPHP